MRQGIWKVNIYIYIYIYIYIIYIYIKKKIVVFFRALDKCTRQITPNAFPNKKNKE